MIARVRRYIIHPKLSQVKPMDCSKSKSVLPKSFSLRENDVLCGRGITCLEHSGNIRFRNIVSSYVNTYIRVTNKKEKTAILDSVADEVRAGGGEFLKYDTTIERYYEVGPLFARDKISQVFRDVIQDHYKSSSFAKQNNRKLRKPKNQEYIAYQNQSNFASYSVDEIQKKEIQRDGFFSNPSPSQSHMIAQTGLESNLTYQPASNQDVFNAIHSTHGELNNLISTSASSDQLKLVATEVDRLEIQGTCLGHSQLHDRSDDSKPPARYDVNKRKVAEEDGLLAKSVSNYPKASDDELIFEKLLEISMTLPTFNDKDSYSPRSI